MYKHFDDKKEENSHFLTALSNLISRFLRVHSASGLEIKTE